MSYYTTNNPITRIYVFFGVSALLLLTPKHHMNLIPVLHVVFFLVTLIAKKDTAFTILIVIKHFVSRDVFFYEDQFPFAHSPPEAAHPILPYPFYFHEQSKTTLPPSPDPSPTVPLPSTSWCSTCTT
jgi:hypothetical protein